MSQYHVDSSHNVVLVGEPTERRTADGHQMVAVRLAAEPDRGYVAAIVGEGGFGDDESPSSYNRPCLAWFGPDESHPDAYAVITAYAA